MVETYNNADEFHRQLSILNANYGKGSIQAIIWDQSRTKLLATHLLGTVVCQLQYGQAARRFSVELNGDGYVLKFLGKYKRMKSDYFIEVTA